MWQNKGGAGMEKETKTLGQAIDEIVRALQSLDEESRVTAIKASCEHLHVQFALKSHAVHSADNPKPEMGASAPLTIADIKSLKEQKQPSSANEMAALVAFYLSESVPESERKQEVGIEDMTKYFKQAGYPLPQKPEFLLTNAKNAGYLDVVGGGKYKLNPVGYNLVAHNMPRTKSSIATKAKKKKGATKKKTSGKK